ncbi:MULTISPECIES: DUF6585 family protein [unclassified Streptomyces]|uniref:DUF6585 family protein n=1 Tax=unclassified Streptomyces TaxID=2593676 RepID=UPI000DC7C541|nr:MULTISPECIES: DUF6585 family protein [unclassified Streptomyces]AWZ06975.1 hypothetical protein DRB89_22775 [Streptomyces sp. ICC4]AWZ15575.1 hypothetical protein DRB96_28665 [Streptomyces sp. ICC1]
MATAPAPLVQEPIPDSVASLAAAQGLGLHRETFLPQRLPAWRVAGLFLFAIFGLACFVLPGLMFVWLLAQSPNLSRKQAAKRIHLFEDGLIVADGTGPVSGFRWDSMTVLQQITRRYANGVYVGTSYVYTLFRQDGSPVKLTNFYADPDRWGTAIQNEITRAQLPGAITALEQGATLHFGDISLTRDGIATAKRGGLHWGEIQKIEIKDGAVFVAKAGKLLSWSNTPVAKIPNFFLFLAAVDRLGSGRQHAGD